MFDGFDRPEDRAGKLRSTFMPCENSMDRNCINGTLKRYYANGQLARETEFFNGTTKDGNYIVYWPNGKVKFELNFISLHYTYHYHHIIQKENRCIKISKMFMRKDKTTNWIN